MNNHVDALATSMQKTNEWIRDLATELGDESRQHAYAVLRAALHTLRDRLTVEQSAHFAAQLPLVLRGTYYEGWKPTEAGQRIRTQEEFVDVMRSHMPDASPELLANCDQAAQASLRVIAQHVDGHTIVKLQESLPKHLRELWPSHS